MSTRYHSLGAMLLILVALGWNRQTIVGDHRDPRPGRGMSTTGSKRSDVHRIAQPAAAKPAQRVFGNDIFCCFSMEGDTSSGESGSVDVCCLDEIIVTTSYRRVFLSATIQGAAPSEGDFGFSAYITDGDSITIVPRITSAAPGEPKTITGAIDLPAGTYEFCLRITATNFGAQISWEEASLQAIVGQIVDEQQCYRPGGGGV